MSPETPRPLGRFGRPKEEPTTVIHTAPPEDTPDDPQDATPETEPQNRVLVQTELDAHLDQVMQAQPGHLNQIQVREIDEFQGQRMRLPEYFEHLSADCTYGPEHCQVHRWEEMPQQTYDGQAMPPKWKLLNPGKYVFHWIMKHKRAIDEAIHIRGWVFVNRTLFSDAPRYLFSASGAYEEGDALLAFMPAEQALVLRKRPRDRSTEMLHSQVTPTEDGKVLMGNPRDPRVYTPNLNQVSDTLQPGEHEVAITEE